MNNKSRGDVGEQEVVSLVPCPNCKKPLMVLPPNYPLFDLQCTGCSFRAQVKTFQTRPKKEFLGAGWEIMEKVLKSGFMVPPLFANFKWKTPKGWAQEILFFPFIPKQHLKKYQLSATAKRANYKMFRYQEMDTLPCFVVFKK